MIAQWIQYIRFIQSTANTFPKWYNKHKHQLTPEVSLPTLSSPSIIPSLFQTAEERGQTQLGLTV